MKLTPNKMAENIVITAADVRESYPISKNINDDNINPHILKAQQKFIKPMLGAALYLDFIENLEEDNYQVLLNGGTYTYQGNEIFHAGIKDVLSSYAYSRFIYQNPIKITRAGNKNKTDEYSTELDMRTTEFKQGEAISEGVRLQTEVLQFLDQNRSIYPLYGKGSTLEKKTETSFSFTKVPRTIQR